MIKSSNITTQRQDAFQRIHYAEKVLLLPNIWDPLSAALIEKLGFPAVATSSSAMSLNNGYPDGEKLPFADLLHILKRILKLSASLFLLMWKQLTPQLLPG